MHVDVHCLQFIFVVKCINFSCIYQAFIISDFKIFIKIYSVIQTAFLVASLGQSFLTTMVYTLICTSKITLSKQIVVEEKKSVTVRSTYSTSPRLYGRVRLNFLVSVVEMGDSLSLNNYAAGFLCLILPTCILYLY